MKLSIITVNLNNRDGLQKTIDSVVSQTFRDFEWIVIDGGSTDGSKELIEQNADHFAYWVSEPDKGIYNAMNKGIRVARGEYLQFLNSGDWYYEPNALNNAFLRHPSADIAFADCNLIENGNIIEERQYPDIMSLKEILDFNICHNSTFFKRSLFSDNLYNEKLKIAADFEFLIKSILLNQSFEHIPSTLISYDLAGISSTNQELCDTEKNGIIKTLISPSILKDLGNIDYLSAHIKDNVLEKVDEYRRKSRLYHKFITASLKLMNHLHRNR